MVSHRASDDRYQHSARKFNGGAENRTRVQESPPSESTCLDASLVPAFRGRVRHRRVSETPKTPATANSVWSRPLHLSTRSRPAHLCDISLRAHEQLAARRSLTFVRRRGPILDYWQLCFPVLFNELQRVSPACIRSTSMTPVETFRPLSEQVDYRCVHSGNQTICRGKCFDG